MSAVSPAPGKGATGDKADGPARRVHTWPHLLRIELLATLIATAVLIASTIPSKARFRNATCAGASFPS